MNKLKAILICLVFGLLLVSSVSALELHFMQPPEVLKKPLDVYKCGDNYYLFDMNAQGLSLSEFEAGLVFLEACDQFEKSYPGLEIVERGPIFWHSGGDVHYYYIVTRDRNTGTTTS